jgi:ABC-type multidrug transport system fused ATPase/permease subunit
LITTFALAGATKALYSNSSIVFLWIFWLLVVIATIVFCMLLATFFTKSTTATLVGLLVFFVGYFVTLAADYATGSAQTISLVSLHPIGALSYGLQEIGRLEDAGIGVTGSTFATSDNTSGFTFLSALQSLLFDSVFWGFWVWYLNRVLRSDYGQPLPFYFPFTRRYWCPGSASPAFALGDQETKYAEGVPVEPVTDALRAQSVNGEGIEIRSLRKVFGDKTAVDGLSLSMYKGQVTALLGHNGAG